MLVATAVKKPGMFLALANRVARRRLTGLDWSWAWQNLTNCSYLLKGGRPFLGQHLKLEEAAAVGIAEAIRALALPSANVEDAFQAAAALA